VEITVVPVVLHPEARVRNGSLILADFAVLTSPQKLYDAIENVTKQRFESAINQIGGVNTMVLCDDGLALSLIDVVQVQTNMLSVLTRLRQLALHPGLVPANYMEQLLAQGDAPASAIKITPESKIRLQAILAQAIEDNEECPICFEVLFDPRITSCAHSFCLAWCVAPLFGSRVYPQT
jgi:SWI/SNF-related matrix-associated actin-dependent regulator of chromatin subfamily A3